MSEEIKTELQHLRNEFQSVMLLFDDFRRNVDEISRRYSQLKEQVKDRLKALEKLEKAQKLTKDEEYFLLPAINEVFLSCNAKVGAKDRLKLSESIYDAKDYCSYWLSELDRS
ncbi:hypothetical protein EHW61_15045 [Salinivibrio sp. VYel6]|uniref:hypothetical protein n=1 Tax=Salinivibrio sp. VYel6 TaxID=2490493 RepID=UPI00128C5C99|nr:hypothetical protein [Salinivibrio sp. VYel6]MPX97955.1 hypothetical protein [Salinivibrio sp. VYel6]